MVAKTALGVYLIRERGGKSHRGIKHKTAGYRGNLNANFEAETLVADRAKAEHPSFFNKCCFIKIS